MIVAAVLGFGIYAFLAITGVQTRWLSRRSSKTAESMYVSCMYVYVVSTTL